MINLYNTDGLTRFGIVRRYFGLSDDCLKDNWNSRVGEAAAIGSFMLPRVCVRGLLIFVLLDAGFEVVIDCDGAGVLGLNKDDAYYGRCMRMALGDTARYRIHRNPSPVAGAGRNQHRMSGRTE